MSDLLSPDAAGFRVCGVDNLKSYRFSSEEFEGVVTGPQVGGHRLYHGHATRPNHFTYFLTVNGPAFSADMADRSVVVELARAPQDPAWLRTTTALVDDHLDDIFADMAAFFRTKPKAMMTYPREAEWARQVLARLPDPDGVVKAVAARQRRIDEDDGQAEDVVDFFGQKIAHELNWKSVGGRRVFVPSTVAARWLAGMNRRFDGGQAAYLKHLQHPRLEYRRTNARRGYVWTGPSAPPQELIETPAFSPTGRPL